MLNSILSKQLRILLSVVLLVIVAGGAAFAIKENHNKTPAKTNQSVSSVQSGGQLQGNQYVLNDLRIKFPLPSELKGLTSTEQKSPANVSPAVYTVQLHLQSYTDLANKCIGTPATTTQSFAILSTGTTLNGQLPPGAKSLKQFSAFYVTDLGPSVPSDIKCQDNAVQDQLTTLYRQLNDALDKAIGQAQSL